MPPTFLETHGPILLGNDKAAKLHLLQAWGIFANPKICPQQHQMILERRNNNIDGWRWRCNRCHPRLSIGIREGTILKDFRGDSGRLVHAIYLWSLKKTGVEIANETGLDQHIVGELRWRLRVCCTNDLLRHPVRISGRQGQPVQIDESMFNHKRRGGVGRRAEKLWVFGMADTRYRPARYHMEVVRNRDRRTLVPIINRHLVGRNVPIHSDMWRAYINLPRFVPNCGLHETVNHTQNFVDPITGAHIQAMESGWNRVKYGFKKAKGCRRNRVQSYLDEFIWIDWRGGNDVFRSVLLIISIDYPH